MAIDIEKSASNIAKDLDKGGQGNVVDLAIQKCFREIMDENPANARDLRRQLVKSINEKEKDGVGDDLTIAVDTSTSQPKHYTIMSHELDNRAKHVAANLDIDKTVDAARELSEVKLGIAKKESDPIKQQHDFQQFILAVDAYEKRDNVKIEYDAKTHQPNKFEITFNSGGKTITVDPADARATQINNFRQEITQKTAALAGGAGEPKVLRNELAQVLIASADLLSQPDSTKTTERLQEQRINADRMYVDAIKLQRDNAAPAEKIADIQRQQGFNLINLASSYNFRTPEGLKAYRDNMDSAIKVLREGDKLLDQNSNVHLPFKVSMLGDLGLAEMGRANPGDNHAALSEAAFKDALRAYKAYKAPDEAAQKSIDTSLFDTVLKHDRYPKLLGYFGRTDAEVAALKDALKAKWNLKDE